MIGSPANMTGTPNVNRGWHGRFIGRLEGRASDRRRVPARRILRAVVHRIHVTPEYCGPVLGPASHLILYHYVVEGEFLLWVQDDDGESLTLRSGDVVLLPRNDLHLMGTDLC